MNLHRKHNHRSAAVLAAVMLALAVATMMVAAMLQSAMITRRQLRLHEQQHQLSLLCDAGARRARHRLSAEASYQGETWSIRADSGSLKRPGEVEIKISRATNGDARVTIVARYPIDVDNGLTRSAHFTSSRQPDSATLQCGVIVKCYL